MKTLQTDVLIIGAGAAGLSVALRLAEHMDVTLVVKGELPGGASYWAQGGISVAVGADDSPASHFADTMEVGGVLCHEDVVRFCVEQAREQLDWLIAQGVEFTREKHAALPDDVMPDDVHNDAAALATLAKPDLHLTREGGHSFRRVVHSDDATGAAIQQCLTRNALKLPRLKILSHRVAVDLIKDASGRCIGAYVLNEELVGKKQREVQTIAAKAVVLATGGASRAYLYSTNPDVASGDGIAMGWRAGCRVANMEFNQFHPTCLYHPDSRTFLLTEALRGEGAVLKLPAHVGATVGSGSKLEGGNIGGTRFMQNYHPMAELAPRDVVARSIDAEMKRHGLEYVLLDISHRDPDFIRSHFPTIYAHCIKLGLDLTRDPIPVVPAAHYTCGGLITNLHGATNVPGLYAVGEVACTGLHGANRMASNSLLECFVFGTAAARHIDATLSTVPTPGKIKPWDESQVMESDEAVILLHNWDELRRAMWNYVGIVRTTKRLERAAHRIALLKSEVQEYYSRSKVTRDLLELRNLVQVAELIVRSAQLRKESRGLHYMADYPDLNPAQAHDTILAP